MRSIFFYLDKRLDIWSISGFDRYEKLSFWQYTSRVIHLFQWHEMENIEMRKNKL